MKEEDGKRDAKRARGRGEVNKRKITARRSNDRKNVIEKLKIITLQKAVYSY